MTVLLRQAILACRDALRRGADLDEAHIVLGDSNVDDENLRACADPCARALEQLPEAARGVAIECAYRIEYGWVE